MQRNNGEREMIEKFLFWITGFLPCRLINDGERPYLERYYIGTLFGWRFYFHRFVGSDPDRGLHDHPWRKAYSLILSGWYWEETRSGIRKVRWFNSLTGDTFHRVVLPCASDGRQPDRVCVMTHGVSPCWTLFMHTDKDVKPWGFLRLVVDGICRFEPYTYEREGSQKEWWKTAGRRGQ